MELWYPKAVRNLLGQMKGRGKYKTKSGGPKGMVWHYDAGGGDPKATIKTALKKGYAYFTIGRDGVVYQNCPLNQWGYHAGRSAFKGLLDRVSDDLVGVEICSSGILTQKGDKFFTYFGREVPMSEVRYSPGKDNIRKGYYHKFTPQQEAAAIELARWLKANDPEVFSFDFCVGHDEVSPGRKVDPGAALSMTMPELRKLLKGS